MRVVAPSAGFAVGMLTLIGTWRLAPMSGWISLAVMVLSLIPAGFAGASVWTMTEQLSGQPRRVAGTPERSTAADR